MKERLLDLLSSPDEASIGQSIVRLARQAVAVHQFEAARRMVETPGEAPRVGGTDPSVQAPGASRRIGGGG